MVAFPQTLRAIEIDLENKLGKKSTVSQGTKVGDMLTLAPERYTAGLYMVTKVIP